MAWRPIILASALLLMGSAAPAQRGDCRLCADAPASRAATDGPDKAMRLDVEAGLVFDGLIVGGGGSGTAVIRPDGSTQVGGSVAAISTRAMVGRAQVRGQPGRYVAIGLPSQIALHNAAGGRLLIDLIASDLPAAPRLDSNGLLRFRFGGRLRIEGEADGVYRGEIPVTADYL